MMQLEACINYCQSASTRSLNLKSDAPAASGRLWFVIDVTSYAFREKIESRETGTWASYQLRSRNAKHQTRNIFSYSRRDSATSVCGDTLDRVHQ